jgi:hypothetical protein
LESFLKRLQLASFWRKRLQLDSFLAGRAHGTRNYPAPHPILSCRKKKTFSSLSLSNNSSLSLSLSHTHTQPAAAPPITSHHCSPPVRHLSLTHTHTHRWPPLVRSPATTTHCQYILYLSSVYWSSSDP